jgi:transketolase
MTTEDLARRIRRDCLRMVHSAGTSHIGSCLSVADLLAVVYGGFANVRPEEPDWP